ncbi:MAG: PilZ domain-containing protein [Terriglobia bacterium]|jgi:hypothetical protein
MEIDQRRSTRIMFSIPVSVRGVDEKGKPFETTGRTITLNRHGARVQVSRPLKPGQTVRVTNQANDAEAEFRVVGPITPHLDHLGEWGIECLHVDKNIWDICFPAAGEDWEAHVLLSCRLCQSMTLQSLSLVEVEVLETAGLLTKPCVHCGDSTPWGYPQRAFEVETKAYQAAVSEASRGYPALTGERRKSYRKIAHLPVRVRDYYGEMEIAQTENISPGAFCFSSRRTYYVGQGIVVICPYDAANEKPEVRAHIVRVEAGSGRDWYVYGVHYEPLLH